MRTRQDVNNAIMRGHAKYKLRRARHKAFYNRGQIERIAKMEAALTPGYVWDAMPPDKMQRTLEILGGGDNG